MNVHTGQKLRVYSKYNPSHVDQFTVVATEDDGNTITLIKDHAWTVDGRPDRGSPIYKYVFNRNGIRQRWVKLDTSDQLKYRREETTTVYTFVPVNPDISCV